MAVLLGPERRERFVTTAYLSPSAGSSELASRFTFARQKSKLAGTTHGSFSVIKAEH